MTEIYSQKFNLEKGWQALFKNLDIPAHEVLRYAQLPMDLLLRKTPAVTVDEYYRFWDGLAYATRNEPTFVVRLAKIVSANTVDPAIIAFLSSNNLNIGLKRIAHYKPIVAPVRMVVERNDQQTVLTFSGLSPGGSLPALFVAFELVFWLELARMATCEDIIPEAVFSSGDLPAQELHEAFVKTRIRPGKENKVIFSATDAKRPFLTVNHAMWDILEPAFDKRMKDLAQEASFKDRVRACLLEMLASGHYSVTYIAEKLAISNRTLQRRLREEGTSFQKVLDELRAELARHYLVATDYTSAEISFLLGYEEPNSFFRAFHAWTGQTPERIRANRLSQ